MTAAFALATILAAWLPQDPPSPPSPSPAASAADVEASIAAVEAAAATLRGTGDGAAATRLTAAIAAMRSHDQRVTYEHVARGIQALWPICPVPCGELCELAIARFGSSQELQTQLGMCNVAAMQEANTPADSRRCAAKAAAAFRAARALGDDEPSQVLLWQALVLLGESDAALADVDTVSARPAYAPAFAGRLHHLRALLLLTGDRPQAALDEIAGAPFAAEPEGRDDEVMRVRSLALAGRVEEAVTAAREAQRRQANADHLMLLADTLGYAGHAEEALALLRDPPLDAAAGADPDVAQSRRALAFLIGLQGKRPDDLRAQLAALLELKPKLMGADGFVVHDVDRPAGQQELDLAATPEALAWHLRAQPEGACSWIHDALFVLCVEDARGKRLGGLAGGLLARAVGDDVLLELRDDGALPRARRLLAVHRMMPGAEGILTVTRLLRD